MSRRVLYILIIVLVLAVAIFVLRPMLTKKPAAAQKSATTAVKGAKAKKGAATDTGAVAAKASKGREKVKAAKGKAAKAAAAKEAAPTPKPAPAETKEVPAAPKDTTPLLWLADPFVRDWMLAGELRDMKLRAVTIGEKSLALINDRIVALGDTVSGKRLVSIARDSVVFEFGGQRRSLKIGE